MASLTPIGSIAGVGAPVPMGLSTGTYFLALANKNEELRANVCGEVHQEYNKLLKEQGLEVHSIPGKTLDALGMDQSTPIARPDLYYLAIHNVLLSYGDTTGIKIEITTDTFFHLLHEENVKNSRNMRGEINSRYNQLLEENGEHREIFGHDLEVLGMDRGTRLSRPDLYFKAFEEIVKKTASSSFDLEARVASVAGKILSRVFTKSREEIVPSLKIAIETMATAGSSATPEISAICSKVNTTLQKIIALLSSPLPATLGNTLCEAALFGHVDAVRALLSAGADVHTYNDEALYNAARQGHVDVVRTLLGAGASVRAVNGLALRMAALRGHAAVVKLLVDAGANVRANGDEALHSAAWRGEAAVVEILLEAYSALSNPDGSEINVSDILFPDFLEAIRTRHMGRENLTALNYLKSGFEIEPFYLAQILEALKASKSLDGFAPIIAAYRDAAWKFRRAAVAWIASHPKGPYSGSAAAAAAS